MSLFFQVLGSVEFSKLLVEKAEVAVSPARFRLVVKPSALRMAELVVLPEKLISFVVPVPSVVGQLG